MASKHPLRRSCTFCRVRKIKCSNETICEACRRQGADCIYDFEPTRSKARARSQVKYRPDPGADGADKGATSPSLFTTRSPTADTPHNSPRSSSEKSTSSILENLDKVAATLEQIFHENFLSNSDTRSCTWLDRISSCNHFRDYDELGSRLYHTNKTIFKNIKYIGILSLLAHDLVGLVTSQLGSLGCHHIEDGGARFFLSGLLADETQTMFDDDALAENPLFDYGQRQQMQLIDVWFSLHPLSYLVSKTLLLRELRDGTHDQILLAIMLAEANLSIGDNNSVSRSRALFSWAISQLWTRPLQSSHGCQIVDMPRDPASAQVYSDISTRIFHGFSTAQALILLGWNALCSQQIRRATCYISLAGRISADIMEQISKTAISTISSRINGIDVIQVEKELITYLYWTAYSLILWSFAQLGGGQFPGLLPTPLASISLPESETSSASIQLDLISGNFSTLQKQKAVVREMWPLAHISSVVAHILSLYHQIPVGMSQMGKIWQETQLHATRRITKQESPRVFTSVCYDIDNALSERIYMMKKKATLASSKHLVLLVYHTIAIHFLFPGVFKGQQIKQNISDDIMGRFCASAEEVVGIITTIAEKSEDSHLAGVSLQSSFFPDILCLALDSCARALSSILSKSTAFRFSAIKVSPSAPDEIRLQTLAIRLYVASQNDYLNPCRALRAIRKHLKACVRAIAGLQPGYSISGKPPPEYALNNVGPSHQPRMSSPCMLLDSENELALSFATAKVNATKDTSGISQGSSQSLLDVTGQCGLNTASDLFHFMLDSRNLNTVESYHLYSPSLDQRSPSIMQISPSNVDFSAYIPPADWEWPTSGDEMAPGDVSTTSGM